MLCLAAALMCAETGSCCCCVNGRNGRRKINIISQSIMAGLGTMRIKHCGGGASRMHDVDLTFVVVSSL